MRSLLRRRRLKNEGYDTICEYGLQAYELRVWVTSVMDIGRTKVAAGTYGTYGR